MKTKRLKTITAGRLVFGVCYTQATVRDGPRQRAAKRKCSSAARQKLNFRFAYQKLRLLLAANFRRGDLWVTLTYDDDHLPTCRKEAKKRATAFWDKMRRARAGADVPLKYVYVTHEILEDGSRRLHHHFMMTAAGAGDYELIRSLWTGGGNIEIKPVGESELFHDEDFLELAQYMLHERNPEATEHATGDRGFTGSRNLERPEEHSELVDDSVTIGAPPGAFVLDRESKQNEWGSYDYICYLLPESGKPKTASYFSVSG